MQKLKPRVFKLPPVPPVQSAVTDASITPCDEPMPAWLNSLITNPMGTNPKGTDPTESTDKVPHVVSNDAVEHNLNETILTDVAPIALVPGFKCVIRKQGKPVSVPADTSVPVDDVSILTIKKNPLAPPDHFMTFVVDSLIESIEDVMTFSDMKNPILDDPELFPSLGSKTATPPPVPNIWSKSLTVKTNREFSPNQTPSPVTPRLQTKSNGLTPRSNPVFKPAVMCKGMEDEHDDFDDVILSPVEIERRRREQLAKEAYEEELRNQERMNEEEEFSMNPDLGEIEYYSKHKDNLW